MRRTLKQQIDANRRLSLWYSSVLVVLLAGLGAAIAGYYDPSAWTIGALGAGALGFIVALVGWTSGTNIVLSISQTRDATPLELRTLNNVTEEMALAAGIPKPEVYLIDDPTPNAFATGAGPQKGVIVVTTGLMEKLDREELQGVISHEMSHIRNNDIKFMTTLALVAGLIPLLADFYSRMVWWGGGRSRDNDRDSGNAGAILMVIGIVLAILAPLFSMLIQLAVSRKRELMADASGAELTRNPDGLVRALEKISRPSTKLAVANRATAHMYIVNPFRTLEDRADALMSTHPPLAERVRALRGLAGMPLSVPPRRTDDFSDMPEIPDQRN